MSVINQKEYLKKYLGIGRDSGEKKKKKKSKKIGKGLKIVDDDYDMNLNEEIQVDLSADNDEAPQIVSVIDDRPPSLRVDEETRNNLWKPIGSSENNVEIQKNIKFSGSIALLKNVNSKRNPSSRRIIEKNKSLNKYQSKEKNSNSCSMNTQMVNAQIKQEKDFSAVKQDGRLDSSSRKHSGDILPTRKEVETENDSSHKKYDGYHDISPPRRKVVQENEDISPPRKAINSDICPHRRKFSSVSLSPIKNKVQEDSDISPPRKRTTSKDISPPRKKRDRCESDSSPPRNYKIQDDRQAALSGKQISNSSQRKSRWGENEDSTEKLQKTLDGKTAGLQNAAQLVKETEELRKREEELFKKLSSEVSGANALTVVRKKKNDLDPEEEQRKLRMEEENKKKYDRWGRGLKQVEDLNEKIKNDLYEMSKPLARYADDEDLERHLKEQEREGDPMLIYLRQKKLKKAVEKGVPVIQRYEGDAPPNRFAIRPGYRWDGVDRSNGYEKKWFEVQNSRKASLEENYKWSTEDM